MVVDGDSLVAGVFVCADMLVDAPVTPPAAANTPLASGRAHSRRIGRTTKQITMNETIKRKEKKSPFYNSYNKSTVSDNLTLYYLFFAVPFPCTFWYPALKHLVLILAKRSHKLC